MPKTMILRGSRQSHCREQYIAVGHSTMARMEDVIFGLGERVRDLRKARKLTQEELGSLLGETPFANGVGQSHLANIENGRATLSVPVLAALAEVLETNTDYLLGLTDDATPHSDLEDQVVVGVKDPAERARLQEALNILRTFSEPEQKLYLDMLRMVIKPRPPRIIGGE